jgi:hypothetical protein
MAASLEKVVEGREGGCFSGRGTLLREGVEVELIQNFLGRTTEGALGELAMKGVATESRLARPGKQVFRSREWGGIHALRPLAIPAISTFQAPHDSGLPELVEGH